MFKKPKNKTSTVKTHASSKAKAPHVGKPKLAQKKTVGGIMSERGGQPTSKKPNLVMESHIYPTPETGKLPHKKGGTVERKGGQPTSKKPNTFVRANTKKRTSVKGKKIS